MFPALWAICLCRTPWLCHDIHGHRAVHKWVVAGFQGWFVDRQRNLNFLKHVTGNIVLLFSHKPILKMSKSFLDLLHVGEWEMSWMSFIHLSCVYLPSLKFSLLCVHVYKMGGVLCCPCENKRTSFWSWFSSTFIWVPGMELRSQDLSSPRYLRHPFIFFREMSVKC